MRYALKGRKVAAMVAASSILAGTLSGILAAPVNAAGPKTGGELVFFSHAQKLNHLDPQRMYTGRDVAFLNATVLRNLVAYKPVPGKAGTGLVPDLATNTGVPSNAAKTWKFTLRPGSTFEDGSPITCADVKYGVSRTFATKVIKGGPSYAISWLDIPVDDTGASAYKGPYTKVGQDLYDKAVTCSEDNRTITFNLKRTVPDFNYFLTYPAGSPVPAALDTADKYDLKPVASGPYKIQKYVIGDELVLVRNSAWKKSSDPIRTPYPNKITIKLGLEEEVRDQIFLRNSIKNAVNWDGDLQTTNNLTYFADKTKAKTRMNIVSQYTDYAAFNVKKVPCLDIRKAVYFAIDMKSIIQTLGGPTFYGKPGDNPVNPLLAPDYAPTKGNIHDKNWKITGNSTYAKTFMDRAKTSCPDVYARVTDPARGLTWDRGNSEDSKAVALVITQSLEKIGMVVKHNYIDPGAYYSVVMDPETQGDVSGAGWGPDWANASTVLPELYLQEGGFNISQNWDDPAYPKFKALMQKALVETNRAKQAKLWQQGSQYVMDQYWHATLTFGRAQYVWNTGVGGVLFGDGHGSLLFGSMYVK